MVRRNRLTQVTQYQGTAVAKMVSYTYDTSNRLVRRGLDPDGAGSQGFQYTYYAYDGNQIVAEFDSGSATKPTHRYLWADGVDQLLADEKVYPCPSISDVLWALGDNLGSVRDLAQSTGGGSTWVTNHRAYDGFGVRTSESNTAVDCLFANRPRFAGLGFAGTPGATRACKHPRPQCKEVRLVLLSNHTLGPLA